MKFPLHPNLIGVLSDATKDRLKFISQVAREHSHDLVSEHALRNYLITEDLGNPSVREASMMHQVCSIAESTYDDWLERGRWLATLDTMDDHDLTKGTHYLRLDEFPTVAMVSGENLSLEGAFVSGQHNSFGGRDYAVTVLLSDNPGPRVAAMSLRELMHHQSNVVMTMWDADNQKPVIAFCGRPGLADHPDTLAGIERIWSLVAPRIGYGEFTPTTTQLKLG